jgi:hypothetical protein
MMSGSKAMREVKKEEKALNHDPLRESDRILSEDFYGSADSRAEASSEATERSTKTRRRRRRGSKPKPTHYKVICISMYNKDIALLEETVAELKRRGYTKANKSQVLRTALSQLDIDKLPPPQP